MSGKASSTLLNCLNLNKLCRPTLRASIQRPRLLCRLNALRDTKLALVSAEAGYGKTTLILDFLRDWQHPVIWYRLDRSDRDVTQFVTYLAEGIAEYFPRFGAELRNRISGSIEGDVASRVRHLLLHEVSKLAPRPILLVLDNFESVAPSREVCVLVSDLLEYSGPEFHIAIASRTMPPLPLARLEARQEVVTLGPGDLALTPDESRELLLGLHEVQITDTQLDVLWQRTEGWPAGLVMVAEALRRRPAHDVVASLEGLRGSPDLVYRYFADEVFQEQSAALQEFLVKTSILRRLSRDVVNDLLEIDNGGELLAAVRTGGIFAHGMEAGGDDLRYHPLFRAFLLQKLHARHGDKHISRLYRRAAQAASRHEHWSEAIDYYAAVEDWEKVAELVERLGEELTRRGFLETVRLWLDLMPEEQIDRRPLLLMLRGRLVRQSGLPHEALRYLNRAFESLQNSPDQATAVLAQIDIGLAHNWLGEFQRAEIVLSDALRRAGDDAALRSRVMADLAGNCIRCDELEQGLRWGDLAVSESIAAGSGPMATISLVRALRYRGRVLVRKGELERGIQEINRSVELCRREHVGDLELSWSLFALGKAYAMRGEFGEACRELDEAEALAQGVQPLLSWIWTWRGTAYRDVGCFEQAERDYLRAGSWARRELAFLRLMQGRVAVGLYLVEEALRFPPVAESTGELARCQVVHGLALAAAGDRLSGLQQVATAAETFRKLGCQQQLASAQWHLARLLLEQGSREDALRHLGEAVGWMSMHGVYHLWWWYPQTIARLWPVALGAGLALPYLLELARQRLGPDESHFLYEALDTAPPALRGQLMETLHQVSGGSIVVHDVAADLLRSCHDPTARRHIGEALASGLLSPHDLAHIRGGANLTWKEIEVLTLYYLRLEGGEVDGRFRQRLAETMAVSEHTLKVHIRNIRRKLNLPDHRRGAYLSPALMAQCLRQG